MLNLLRQLPALSCLLAFPVLAQDPASRSSADALRNWPQWRGPLANGIAPLAHPPVHWSETNNIRWKFPLPGKAHSSPIVFGDSVFLTAAVPVGESQKPVFDHAPGTHDNVPVTHRHQFVVFAVARRDGTILWKKSVREEFPHEGGHETGSLASNSPVTDGERLYAFFGSHGLYCLDRDRSILDKLRQRRSVAAAHRPDDHRAREAEVRDHGPT